MRNYPVHSRRASSTQEPWFVRARGFTGNLSSLLLEAPVHSVEVLIGLRNRQQPFLGLETVQRQFFRGYYACNILILLFILAEVHGNRTHPRAFGPYTGFEEQKIRGARQPTFGGVKTQPIVRFYNILCFLAGRLRWFFSFLFSAPG